MWKISNSVLIRYTQPHVPDEVHCIRHVGCCYNNVISDTRDKLAKQFILLSVDGSIEFKFCLIAIVIVNALNKEQQIIPYLLNVSNRSN